MGDYLGAFVAFVGTRILIFVGIYALAIVALGQCSAGGT